ncbi:MAG: tetratricopeptide repeat protein [Candidatus Melainabacteria bacterium]|nr:tetratricopeptide repeat protein [Candidatus Melainabacteria bacterium]
MERRDTTTHDDNSLTTAVSDGFQAAVYTGIQQPYDSIRQIAGKVHIDLPETHLASAPADAKAGSAAWFAESIGGAAGMLPWIVASHKMVRAGSSFAGLSTETSALTASGMGMREAGLTGAVYSTLFQPVQDNGNFLLNKAKDAGIGFGTFAAGAGLNNTIRPMLGSFTSEISNRVLTAGTASLSAFGAGVINAEAGNVLGKPHQDALQTGLKFALVGGIFGAASKNNLVSETERAPVRNNFDTRVNAMSQNLGASGDPLIMRPLGGERTSNNFFADRPAGPPGGSDIFGPRPEVIERSLTEIKSRYGENSPEHASTLVQLGDAHMVQGRLSNPAAQASYEQALQIFRGYGEDTPQTAWVYDKLANVKQSSGDSVGAASDLSKALEIWRADSKNPDVPNENHIARRSEDLARMQVLNRYSNRSPLKVE